jgi:hypothetical protein
MVTAALIGAFAGDDRSIAELSGSLLLALPEVAVRVNAVGPTAW